MSDDRQTSKTIVVIVAIVAVTLALFGTEAWNRSHAGRKVAATPATAVTAPPTTSMTPSAPHHRQPAATGPDHGTPDANGEIMMNE